MVLHLHLLPLCSVPLQQLVRAVSARLRYLCHATIEVITHGYVLGSGAGHTFESVECAVPACVLHPLIEKTCHLCFNRQAVEKWRFLTEDE